MKVVTFSDSHGKHRTLTYYSASLPQADMIIFAGDFSDGRGSMEQTKNFLTWFSGLNFKHKLFIVGNHDLPFENPNTREECLKLIPDNVMYLENSGVEIEGINIWGSPITPSFGYKWAFNKSRGHEISQVWKQIPKNTDILITHGPPYEILDQTISGHRTGCQDLLKRVKEIKPKYHIFGHIHEAADVKEIDGTTFINASYLDEWYSPKNDPVVFDI